MIFKKHIALVLMLVALVACEKRSLLEGLDQKNANDVLVVLSKNGIQAQKKSVVKQQETTWQILVDSGDEAQARELLVANNLPRQRELGLSGVCKDAGLIPTPKTEKCREMLALKGEIINSLQSIPGVVSADVVINMPDKQDFPDENVAPQRPAASVVLQLSELGDPEMFTEAKIQQFVSNAVTGMDMRDVVVLISRVTPAAPVEAMEVPVVTAAQSMNAEEVSETETEPMDASETVSVLGVKMDQDSVGNFRLLAVLVLVIFVILSAVLVYAFVKNARVRQQSGGLAVIPQALPQSASSSRETAIEQDRVGIE